MIVAAAGRRVDAPGERERRFPPENAELVKQRILKLLQELGVTTVVTSGACGADLLTASAASDLGCHICIVLPYEIEKFRTLSVTDRPGEWGPVFDNVVGTVVAAGDLVILPPQHGSAHEQYIRTNMEILTRAEAFGRTLSEGVKAIAIWDERSRGKGDLTQHFIQSARDRGLQVLPVSTV